MVLVLVWLITVFFPTTFKFSYKLLCNMIIRYSYENTVCLTVSLPGNNLHLGVFGNQCFSVSLSYFCQGRTRTCIRNDKCSLYTLLPSSWFLRFISIVWTLSCKTLCALTSPWGVMDVQCVSLLVSILQAESVYFGWEKRDAELGSCLEFTLYLLALSFLTSKKKFLFLLTKFMSWNICQSRR